MTVSKIEDADTKVSTVSQGKSKDDWKYISDSGISNLIKISYGIKYQ